MREGRLWTPLRTFPFFQHTYFGILDTDNDDWRAVHIQDRSSVWDAVHKKVLFVRVHLLQRHVSHEPAARFCTYQSPAPRRHSEQVSDLVCVMSICLVCYVCACGLISRLTCFLTPQPVVATGAGLKAARPLGAAKLLRVLAPSHHTCQRSGR